jgi:hypothetical protein
MKSVVTELLEMRWTFVHANHNLIVESEGKYARGHLGFRKYVAFFLPLRKKVATG